MNRARRSLVLRRETLTPLTGDDLAAVAGGAALPTIPINVCLVMSGELSCNCQSNPPKCNLAGIDR